MLSDSISDRTLLLWLIVPCRRICSNKTNVPADLHELLSAAKNLPELSIRIFNPLASYCYLIGMNCGSQILIFDTVEFFAALNNTCISDRTIALWLIVPTGRTLPLWLSGNDMQQQDPITAEHTAKS